jgi:hypothetical protein
MQAVLNPAPHACSQVIYGAVNVQHSVETRMTDELETI